MPRAGNGGEDIELEEMGGSSRGRRIEGLGVGWV